MKKLLLLLTTATVMASSCKMNVLKGEGPRGTTVKNERNFSAVDIELPIEADIVVVQGSTPKVELKGYENVLKHIVTRVEGNTLRIYTDLDDTWELDCDEVVARITVPSLSALALSGAPDAAIHGNITGPRFDLDISGASEVSIEELNVDRFSSEVSGAAEIAIKNGYVRQASYEVSGAGEISAFGLQTEETTTSISGAGKGEVSASKKLVANISGAASVQYKGHPSVSQDISGAGSVTNVN